jgi:hypothetical protein
LLHYKRLLFGDGGSLTDDHLFGMYAIIHYYVASDRGQLLTEALVPTVLKAARSHAARSTAARA